MFYELDFGFNNQTALVRVKNFDGELFVDQLIYDTKMSTALLIDRMRSLGLDRNLLDAGNGSWKFHRIT